jgi:cytochrome c oxidase subunit III
MTVMPTAAPPAGTAADRPALLNVGTIVWLASELMFFSGLFAAYFTLRAQAVQWPPPGVHLDTVSATIATAVLVLSSGTMQLAVRATLADQRRRFEMWLGCTFVLGVVFIAAQARDWSKLTFGVSSHAYGSAFYLMTGFHGLHVIGGLLAMTLMAGRAASARFGVEDAPAVEMLSYYWHFVDVVWIGLWATIFFVR